MLAALSGCTKAQQCFGLSAIVSMLTCGCLADNAYHGHHLLVQSVRMLTFANARNVLFVGSLCVLFLSIADSFRATHLIQHLQRKCVPIV